MTENQINTLIEEIRFLELQGLDRTRQIELLKLFLQSSICIIEDMEEPEDKPRLTDAQHAIIGLNKKLFGDRK